MNLLGHLVVGVELDEEETALADEADRPIHRVYIDARWKNRYVLAPRGQGERAMSGPMHNYIDLPAGMPIYEDRQLPNQGTEEPE